PPSARKASTRTATTMERCTFTTGRSRRWSRRTSTGGSAGRSAAVAGRAHAIEDQAWGAVSRPCIDRGLPLRPHAGYDARSRRQRTSSIGGIGMKRFVSLSAMFVALVALPAIARAEVGEITIAQQYGMAYLQFLVMQRDHLIVKHAKAAGLGDVKVTWHKFSASNIMYDAVLSGDLQIASGGLTPLITIWARTRDNYKAHGLAAMNAMPLLLNTRELDVKSIKDFTSKSRIALPAVKISQQAITLQMAAAKALGDAGFNRLDPLTVSMSHPDGMQALMSG